jgi:hypothetical protein
LTYLKIGVIGTVRTERLGDPTEDYAASRECPGPKKGREERLGESIS